MSLPVGLHQRNGIWHLRILAPNDLAHLHPSGSAYRASLRTRDRAEAITKAHELQAQWRRTFDEQRTAEAIKRAPPLVPLTPELETYLAQQAGWTALLFDDVLRFTPGAVDALAPARNLFTGESMPRTDAQAIARWNELQQLALTQAKADLAEGRLSKAQEAADADLAALGVRVDWDDSKARLGLMRIARAQVRAYALAAERSTGEPHDTPDRPQPPANLLPAQEAPVAQAAPSATLADVVPDWVTRTRAKPNAQQRTAKALALWAEAVGHVPLSRITRATGAEFVAYLLDPTRTFGSSTAANHAAAINALMNMAVKVGKVDRNPLDLSFRVEGAEQRHPWTAEELQTIFTAPMFTSPSGPLGQPEPHGIDPQDARLWLSLLLWSGARAGEIAQLRTEDLQQRDGVLCLHITAEAGTVKTAESERWLPVASVLVPLVQAHAQARKEEGSPWLFPSFYRRAGTSPADMATKWFKKFREARGLPAGKLQGSHRFRHAVRTRLAELGVSPELGDQLTGHAKTGSTGSRVYTGTVRPAVLLGVVDRLGWKWPAVLPARGSGTV